MDTGKRIYWLYLFGYYLLVACLMFFLRQVWLGKAAFVPLYVLDSMMQKEKGRLVQYLQTHHQVSWPSMAAEWCLNWRAFIFSDVMDDDLDLFFIKESIRQLCRLVTVAFVFTFMILAAMSFSRFA